MKAPGIKQYSIYIPPELHDRLAVIAAARTRTLQRTIRLCWIEQEALQQYVESIDLETGLPARSNFLRSDAPTCRLRLPSFRAEVDFHQLDDAALFQAMDESRLMLWVARPDNWCLHVNKTLTAYTGRTLEQFLGVSWTDVFHPDDRARALKEWRDKFRNRKPCTVVYRVRRADGLYGWIADHAEPRYHPDGRFAGYIGAMHEIATDGEEAPLESLIPAPQAEAQELRMTQFLQTFTGVLNVARRRRRTKRPRANDADIVVFECKHHSEE